MTIFDLFFLKNKEEKFLMENRINKKLNEENLKCPVCEKNIEGINNIINFNEYDSIHCEKCDLNIFLYVLCVFCKKKIYYKKNNNNNLLNGMNGFNIQCPYLSCGKYFYETICPKCKHEQKIPKRIKEGELIKCINENNACGYEYIQIRSPIKDSNDNIYLTKPKHSFSNIITLNLSKDIIFQKISCFFCIQPIVFISNKNKEENNRCVETMKIICPYSNCGKTFIRLVCPLCFHENILKNGFYLSGHKLKCNKCQEYFGKILCPKCLKVNPLQKIFFKSGAFRCRYTECTAKSFIVNCIFCQRINVFDKQPLEGQRLQCAYEDCGKYFNEVYCPSCGEINPFPNGTFSFGKAYQCIYSFCHKIFQYFVCPKCIIYSKTTDIQEGKNYVCCKCQTSLHNWECNFCHETIMDQDSTLKYGQIVRCPNNKCKKEYSFCRCYGCQKLIFSKENEYILGLAVMCNNCKKFSVNIACPLCNVKISFIDRLDDMNEGEIINCKNCKESFKYSREGQNNEDIYSSNLSILETIKGKPIKIGKGEVDENYLSIKNLLINSELYKDSIDNDKKIIKKNVEIHKRNKKLCILCHCDTKESIFYPCGHRVTCYKCAVFYFEVFKKCPKCNKPSLAIIPKIYEQFYEKSETEIENTENK